MVALPNVSCFLKLDNKLMDNGKLLSIGLVAGTLQGVIYACRHSQGGGGGEGALQISSDGDVRRIFWVGKFGKYFLGIQNNLKIRGSTRIIRPHCSAIKVQSNLFSFQETFKARKFGMGFILN